MFKKGRYRDVNRSSGDSPWRAFRADSLRKLLIWEPKIDAETHRKSMQKQVQSKSMKIIKNHDLLMWKNIEIHYKTIVFDGLQSRARERKRYHELITNNFKIYQKGIRTQ